MRLQKLLPIPKTVKDRKNYTKLQRNFGRFLGIYTATALAIIRKMLSNIGHALADFSQTDLANL
jgi:hypothetical protein